MRRFEIEVTNSGAAFEDPGPELARILRALADDLEQTDPEQVGEVCGELRDINGNRCGRYTGAKAYDAED